MFARLPKLGLGDDDNTEQGEREEPRSSLRSSFLLCVVPFG